MEIKKLLLKKRKKQGSNSSQISLIFQAKEYAFALQKNENRYKEIYAICK